MMHEDFKGMGFIFAAETADMEALKPHMLAEAKCRPDWPSWEKAIKEELAHSRLLALGGWKTHRLESTSLAPNGFSRLRRMQWATSSAIRPVLLLRASARLAALTMMTPTRQ
jgi:hypothetical protein